MFSIQVRYTTGNTFGSHEEEDILELKWDSREKARRELQKLKKHWIYVKQMESSSLSKEEKKTLKSKAVLEDWFGGSEYSYQLYLNDNDGKREYVYAMWLGYFETLHEATIVVVDDDDSEDADTINFDTLNYLHS